MKDIDDLHIQPIKIRLTLRDAELLSALAARRDIPLAVLARQIIVRALEDAGYTSVGTLCDKRRSA